MKGSTPIASAAVIRAGGYEALSAGDHSAALDAFRRAVAADPSDSESLLLVAEHSPDPQEALRYLAHALTLDPHNPAARRTVRLVQRRLANAGPSTRTRGSLPDYLLQFGVAFCLLLAVLLGGAVLLLMQTTPAGGAAPVATETPTVRVTPSPTRASSPTLPPTATADYGERVTRILRELDAVWAAEDWERAARLIAEALAFRPGDAALRQKLVSAYFNRGVELLDEGDTTRALWAFDQALEVQPGAPQVVQERTVLVNYLAGIEQYNARNWVGAAQSLAKVYGSDAGYLDTRELLYRAYFNQGTALKERKDLPGALKAFESAVDMDNEALEARAEAAQIRAALTPPTPKPPSATGEKWIDVNLKTQRMLVYQGQTVVYNWIVSTGEPGRPTIPGRFKILDKIPLAYSRVWRLWMPSWMGIYWAGTVENGIHALPILRSGAILWSGFLGRRISFGCVVLETNAAKTLFDWAQIDTPVIIHN